MIAETYHIRPWEMDRLTTGEWNQIARDLDAKRKAARKEARSR